MVRLDELDRRSIRELEYSEIRMYGKYYIVKSIFKNPYIVKL